MVTGKQESQRRAMSARRKALQEGVDGSFYFEEMWIPVEEEDGYEYEEVCPEEESGAEEGDEEFEEAMRATREAAKLSGSKQQTVPDIPEPVDDFLRNFLLKMDLERTLDDFQTEWYGAVQRRSPTQQVDFIPDAFTHNLLLENELETVQRETDGLRQTLVRAGESLVRMQRETDFHRLQYRRVSQDKTRLTEDLKRLKRLWDSYQPAVKQLEDKHQAALRQKMLLSLERNRLQTLEDNPSSPVPLQPLRQKTPLSLERDRLQTLEDNSSSPVPLQPLRQKTPLSLERDRLQTLEDNPSSPVPLLPLRQKTPLSLERNRLQTLEDNPSSPVPLQPLRQKTPLSLERDRLQTLEDNPSSPGVSQEKPHAAFTRRDKHPTDSEFPVCGRADPRLAQIKPTRRCDSFSLHGSIRAHDLPISCLALHPRKLILASASDDRRWRLWGLPADGEKVGEMIMTGEGHTDWLSGCSFHPDGGRLATTSGDTTVRLWDFARGCCVLTLAGHSRATWGCSFHTCGDFLVSCSMDKTAKLWDLNSRRCRSTLRRHADSVNSVSFLPFSNILLTSSADKTVALWDARSGLCTQTFYGHQHSCNHAVFSPPGDTVASCDSHGVVKLWDVRKTLAMVTMDTGPSSSNQVAFSPSGKTLAVAGHDGLVRLVDLVSSQTSSLSGHSDAVQNVMFDHNGERLISAGSDGLVLIWS